MIQKYINQRFKKLIKSGLSDLKLASLRNATCNFSHLRVFTPEEIRSVLNDESILDHWDSAKSEIDSLALPEMTGGVNVGDQRAIFYLITYLKPKKVLEIGTHIGCSTTNIAVALKSTEFSNLISVDIYDVNDELKKNWLKYGSKYSPKELLAKVGFSKRSEFITMPSIEYLKTCSEKFDFIFLDGSHDAPVVYQEVPLALNLLNENGVILLHDYYPDNKPIWNDNNIISGPFLAVKRLKKTCDHIDVIPFGKLPWKTKLGSNFTSLALLTRK